MKLKWVLTWAPTLLVLVLFLSAFWVPTYDAQTRGNPSRLRQFVEASIGDARILNPILHADTASGRIVDLVFEGLLGLDDNLQLRGRLAEAWDVGEEIVVPVYPSHRFPDDSPVTGVSLYARLRQAVTPGQALAPMAGHIETLELVSDYAATVYAATAASDDPGSTGAVRLRIPEAVRLRLSRVDEGFSERLAAIVGDAYGGSIPSSWLADQNPAEIGVNLSRMTAILERPVVTFRLRRGVRFHDGHELDAGDILFTYQAIMDPRSLSPRTSDFEPVQEVVIDDAHTVRVVYKRLFSPALNAWTIGILPEHLLNPSMLRAEQERRNLTAEARASFGLRDSEFNRHPVGAGPFVFESWDSDELITLRRHDGYWDVVPQYERYFYRVLPDPLAQEMEFRAGTVDVYSPQPHQIARFRDDERYRAFSSLSTGYTYIGYNNRRPLFSDPLTRRALGLALDTDAIIEYVLYGEGERISGPYPKNTIWYDQDVAPLPYDPDQARRLLESLGWRRNADGWLEKDGRQFEFNLITNNGNPVRKAIMTIAQNAWRAIGIKVNTQVFEWAVFLEDFINPGEFDAVILGWVMGPDPDLFQIWHSSQTRFGQLNAVGYDDADSDALIERIRRTYDPSAQQRLAHALHRRVADQQPYTFLFARLATQVLDRKIVMVNDDGSFVPIEAVRSGNLYYHFNRWRKLESALAP